MTEYKGRVHARVEIELHVEAEDEEDAILELEDNVSTSDVTELLDIEVDEESIEEVKPLRWKSGQEG
jgi:hypothetical protein